MITFAVKYYKEKYGDDTRGQKVLKSDHFFEEIFWSKKSQESDLKSDHF